MKKTLIFIALLALSIKGFAFEDDLEGEGKKTVRIEDNNFNHKIEIFIQTPSSQEFPLLLFLHGASSKVGLDSISHTWFDHWLDKGYAVAAVSMPGFGQSAGNKDFCGPLTMEVLNIAINVIKEKLNVQSYGIFGFGQGGVAAILLAAQRPDVQCVVCSNGVYDLQRHNVAGDKLLSTIQAQGYDFDVYDEGELAIRSPVHYIASLNTPLFLLHRRGHSMVSENEVIDFHQTMFGAGKACEISFKGRASDDKLTIKEVLSDTEAWVDSIMK